MDFESYFDNREYNYCEEIRGRSGTDFAARLTPSLSFAFCAGNTLNLGVEMEQQMGSDELFGGVKAVIFYGYDSERWTLSAGVFQRERMEIEGYSTAFFSEDYLFESNLIEGIQSRYSVGESYIEAVLDWEGVLSETTRERFRLLSSARRYWSSLYLGYNLSLMHFAGAGNVPFDNVVDNVLLNPCVGARWRGVGLEVEAKASYLQALQRDRSFMDGWIYPSMGEAALKVEYRGFGIDERFYWGDDIIPLYGGHVLDDGTVMEYGEQLYAGDRFFRAEGGFYNRTAFEFRRSFCREKMELRVAFVTHIDGAGVGYEQSFRLRVRLGERVFKR